MAKNIFGNRPGLENMNLGITECTPVNLEMSLIDENPKNEKIFNMSKIDDLAKYIKEKGFYQPILVFQKENGRYEIIAGHRKYRAKKLNGDRTIPAVVKQAPKTEGERSYQLIMDNMQARTLTPIDTARSMKELSETWIQEQREAGNLTGKKKDILAEIFHCSAAKVSRLLRLLQLDDSMQALIADGIISVDAVSPLYPAEGDPNAALQKHVLQGINKIRENDSEAIITKKDIEKLVACYKTVDAGKIDSTEEKGKTVNPKATFRKITKNIENISELEGYELTEDDRETLKTLAEKIDHLLNS